MHADPTPPVQLAAEPLPDSALEALADARAAAVAGERHSRRLVEQLDAMATPARPELIELTPTTPAAMSNAREISRSVGLLNPNPGVACWLGLGGLRADANGYPVPAQRAVILPLAAEDVEIAAIPAPGQRVVVVLLRFQTVQPFFVGAFA